jgi:hypothetical protein
MLGSHFDQLTKCKLGPGGPNAVGSFTSVIAATVGLLTAVTSARRSARRYDHWTLSRVSAPMRHTAEAASRENPTAARKSRETCNKPEYAR